MTSASRVPSGKSVRGFPQGLAGGCLTLLLIQLPLVLGAASGIVRHPPTLNGEVNGSLQVLVAEDLVISGRGRISADLLVSGTPTVQVQGNGNYGMMTSGSGSVLPADHVIILKGSASVHRIVRRTDPVELGTVEPPSSPAGTRSISINAAGMGIGDPATLLNLTLNGNAGAVALPPGTYGTLTANGSSKLVLGFPDVTTPAVYELQALSLNGSAELILAGPVRLILASDLVMNGSAGVAELPDWLQIELAGNAGIVLNGNATLHAGVKAPGGALRLNGNAKFNGTFQVDRLVVNGNGVVRLSTLTANLPPEVSMTSPLEGTRLPAPPDVTLGADATDPDGTITKVEFLNHGLLVGAAFTSPYEYQWSAVPAGTYEVTARAYDDDGASTASAPVTFQVIVNTAPQVDLVAPGTAAVLVAPATVDLIAVATDVEGPMARVEFFDDDTILGSATTPAVPPGTFVFTATLGPGHRLLMARAHDADGAFADSATTAIRVYPGLPYIADFEPGENYQVGFIDGQLGWSVPLGAVQVQSGGAASGSQSVAVLPGEPASRVRQDFLADPTGVVFVDVHARLAAGTTVTAAAAIESDQGRVALLQVPGGGQVMAFDGLSGVWKALEVPVILSVGPDGLTMDWVRFTFREDHVARTWDLYLNGVLKAVDLGFRSPGLETFGMFAVTGHATTTTFFDSLFIGGVNPVFEDLDQDGIDDAYEIAHGLDPTRNDRDEDADGDGFTNIWEYLFGTRADLADTDGDGMPDAWEVLHGLDPLTDDAADDPDGDGVSNYEEYLLGRNPNRGAIPAPDGAVNLRVFSPAK